MRSEANDPLAASTAQTLPVSETGAAAALRGRLRDRAPVDDLFTDSPVQVSFESANALRWEERRELRTKMIVGAVALVVVFFVSLCIKPTLGNGFNNPLDVLQALWLHVQWGVGSLVGHPSGLGYAQIISEYPAFYQVESRLSVCAITLVCGVLLALSGSLYQMVFNNPIAAPTMLGVSNGMSLGLLLMVIQFGAAALNMDVARHLYAYGGAVVVLALVLGTTRLACGRNKAFSVVELLLVGSIYSQVFGSVVSIVSDTYLTDDMWEIYQQLSEATSFSVNVVSVVSVAVAVAVAVVPVFLMRYSINTMNYSAEEARLIGLDTTRLKTACLVCGTLMILVAQVNMGTVSMVTLVVPFISRAVFGTEFKHQFWGDVIIGALLLLVCRDLVLLIPFFHMEMSLGTVVSFVTLPVYVWIIVSRQRGWK